MKKFITAVFVLALMSSSLYAQTENWSSKIYFPALIGVAAPFDNDNLALKNGSSINTAIEYRPVYINAFFLRLNYDALNNKYQSYVYNLPTNVVNGKLSTSFFLAGGGYRWKVKNWGIYCLLQPGIGTRSFNRALINSSGGITINNVTRSSFTVKTGAGFEYYIVKHFALIAEPTFYKLFSSRGFNNNHSQVAGLNIGFTTTLF